jgi:23S rRNA pseudouridine1911/1915/1917 synthase
MIDEETYSDETSDETYGEELFEHFSITADRGQSLLRIDKFLTHRMEHVSRARIQNAADDGNILVNGVPVRSNYKVKPGDHVQIVMPYPKREIEIIPENIPLNVVHEDDDLMVIDKSAGLVVHPGHGNYSGTLVNALAFHLQKTLADGSPIIAARAGLVHRIDKNTSGLLVVAKNEYTHNGLAKQFFDHTVTRRYVALVWGNFDDDQGTVTGNIGRSHYDRLRMAVFPGAADLPPGVEPEGKHAVTHWRVLQRYGYVTLLELRLETGRTHQIRVHMEHIGHPLFNDERYGGDRVLKGTTFSKYKQFMDNNFRVMPRHALHARSLGFVHPRTRQELHFESPMPDDFATLLSRWDTYTAAMTADNI